MQKYLTVSDHGYIGYGIITNQKFWDGLPADIRQKLEEAMNEATAYNNEIAQKDNDDALAAIQASGRTEILQLSPAEKAEWRKALLPVHKEMESRIGAPLIAQIYKETGAESAK